MKSNIARSTGRALLMSLPFLSLNAMAVSFSETANTAYVTKASGTGWRLVSMPTSNFLGGEYTAPAASLPTDPQLGAGYTAVYMIDSLEGLNNSPLPASLKSELASDFDSVALQKSLAKRRSGKLTQKMVSEDDTTPAKPGPIFVHKGVADAIAAGNAQALYGAFTESDTTTTSSLCHSSWHSRTKSGSINVSNSSGPQSSTIGGGFSGTINASLPANGTINYTFNYAYKKNSCIGIPYAAKMESVKTKGNLNVDNTQMQIDGSISYNSHWESRPSTLFHKTWTVWVGPLPVILGLEIPYHVGLDVNATLSGSISTTSTGTGVYSFDYNCTSSGCTGTNSSNIQFTGNGGTRSNAALLVNAKPYLALEAIGYVYDASILSAGLGGEISAPSTYWAYQGNNCDDADGDGINENLKTSVLDVNAQLAVYGKFQILGNKSWKWINLNSSTGGYQVYRVDDYSTRGKPAFNALRRNLFFREFENISTSALTPVISGPASTSSVNGGYSASMRSCFPFKERLNYSFDWGDGSSPSQFSGPKSPPTYIPHNFAAAGYRNLKLTVLSDSLGRNYGNASTSRTILVAAPAIPGAPTALTVPTYSGANLNLNWSAASGIVQSYEVQQQNPGSTSWATATRVPNTWASIAGLANGSYKFRVRACNISGCGPTTAEQTVNIVTLPPAPTLNMSVENLCEGENYAWWPAMSGAIRYELHSSTSSNSATASLHTRTSATNAHLQVSENTYFWLKACNSNVCSDYSAPKLARFEFNPRVCL
jgi:hypothetical protein